MDVGKTCIAIAVAAVAWSGAANAVMIESDPTPICGRGEVYQSDISRCVAVDRGVEDSDLLITARGFLDAERFQEAMDLLERVRNRNSATYYNYLGFATRKLGRPQEAVDHYHRALVLDPYYAEAREYLGEAYIMLDRPDLAEEQLVLIQRICGSSCEAYIDLQEALAATK